MRYFSAVSLLGLAFGLVRTAHAQQPFERFGLKVKVATLSNGRYPEFFRHDSLRRIGSVVYNTRLHRIAYLLPADSLVGRAKSEVTSRWMSPDPLAEKFLYISPYVFVENNPIRYNDPDGREGKDVILGGSQRQAAFQELQASVRGSLILTMDNSGKVTYTPVAYAPSIQGGAKQLMTAIDDHSVNVNVTAENTKVTSTNQLYIGGAFMGNSVSQTAGPTKANVVDARQEVNPSVTSALDNYNGKPGATMLHEVVESYLGGAQSQQTGVASPVAGLPGSNYQAAHNAAPPQGGPVYETAYDKKNNVVPITSPSAARAEYSTQQGTKPPAIIMTFP